MLNSKPSFYTSTYLEINDNSKDKYGGNQVHKVGEILPIEGFPESSNFVCASSQQMEQGNDGAFKLHAF